MIANNRRVHIDLDVRGNGCSVMLHPKNMAVRALCSLSAFTRSAKIFIAANPAQIIVFLGQLLSLRRAFTRSPGDVLDLPEVDVVPVRHVSGAARILR